MCIGEKMSQSNIDLIRFLYDAFDRRGQAAVAVAMDPEVEFRQTEHLPWGGYYKASPTVSNQFFSKLLARIESKVDVERMWEAGNAAWCAVPVVDFGILVRRSTSPSHTYGRSAIEKL